jgi:hypothetical protein
MLFGLLIVDENFALLTVTAWLILGSPNDREDVLCLLEDGIHFLKRAVRGFWIEEIDDWEDKGIAMGGWSVSKGEGGGKVTHMTATIM